MKRTFLPRLQLFELMDLDWFPGWLRRYQTDCLLFSWRHFAPKKEIARQLSTLIARSSSETIVDLVRQQCGRDLSLVLTDAFPNREAQLADGISYWPEPVDARTIDRRLSGFRTVFGSLHHFSPREAREILLDAKRARQPIAVYEMTPRSLRSLVLIALNTMFGTLLFTPLLRPFSWQRLLFTYALPLVPLTLLFDGIISVFRTYTEGEMLEMIEGGTDLSYEWQSGVHGSGPALVVYLLGSPT